ncbi:MAG: 50S ribosomal protein L21e [Nanoarchaeota archaeon]
MAGRKKMRTRGKIQLSRYFQEINKGDIVAVVKEPAIPSNFPKRMQGRTGIVENKRGRAFIVKIMDQNKEKKFIIEPVHLKKIKTADIQKI